MYEKRTLPQRLYDKFEAKWARTSLPRYLNYLRKKGIKLGKNITTGGKLNSIVIDLSRPSMIEIGDNVRINQNLTILSHDGAVSTTLKTTFNEFIPNSGRVKIGNNVYFGRNCTVMKGVEIGDNCLIGFGSVVTKNIPSNSFAVGAPAKVLGTLESYYNRRKALCEKEAFDYARSIVERYNRRPVAADFWEEFPLFVNGDEVDKYPTIPIRRQLDDIYDHWVKNHKKTYENLDAFLKAAGID